MTETIEKPIEDINIEFPKNWNVIYHNDNVTPFAYVVLSLASIFGYQMEDAIKFAEKIEDEGKGVVGNYPKPIAEAKMNEVLEMNRRRGVNLEVTIEEEQ